MGLPELEPGWDDKPREACGVFAVYSPEGDIPSMAYLGAGNGQHRGQDAAGIAVGVPGKIMAHKSPGLVYEVFPDAGSLAKLDPDHNAEFAVAHTLYSTSGDGDGLQPVIRQGEHGRSFALAHNGHLEPQDGRGIGSHYSDTYWFADRISRHWRDDVRIEEAVEATCHESVGAYSCTVLAQEPDGYKILGFRDPHGFRPLEIGQLPNGGAIIASENGGFHQFGAGHLGSVEPGTIVTIDKAGLRTRRFAEAALRLCAFEAVYFARPSSTIEGVRVNRARFEMGRLLAAQETPPDADLVIGVPESGLRAAEGYAYESKIPYATGLERNRYVTRTFIKSHGIVDAVTLKQTPLLDVVEGRRLIVVDDSIVRGNTMRSLISMLMNAGAKSVDLRISSPPYKWPCFYGMATSRRDSLIANTMSHDEMAEHFGVRSLDYLRLDNLVQALGKTGTNICDACFTGNYPTAVPVALSDRK